ncbi:MAG: hypothetical protein ACT4QE_05205, partial [Anaerolineales bacterium]
KLVTSNICPAPIGSRVLESILTFLGGVRWFGSYRFTKKGRFLQLIALRLCTCPALRRPWPVCLRFIRLYDFICFWLECQKPISDAIENTIAPV